MSLLKSIPHRKSILRNYRRTAYTKLLYHVTHVLGYKREGLKINTAIRIFAEHYKLEYTYPLQEWIVSLYIANENEIIKRNKDGFYNSSQWKALRNKILGMYGTKCMKCNSNSGDHVVDHIKPRSKFPTLELEISNMQVLCNTCNLIKSNKAFIDYRIL